MAVRLTRREFWRSADGSASTVSRRAASLLVAALAIIAVLRLGYESWRLLLDQGPNGAIDLALMRLFMREWFAGEPVYRLFRGATHLPATFAMMWPFVGWEPWTAARWIWGIVTGSALAVLVVQVVRSAPLEGTLERRAAGLLVLAMASTGIGLGNGQVTILQLAAFLSAILLFLGEPAGWRRDGIAALLLLVALIKPHVTVPLFWVVLFALGGLRPVLVASAAYAAITLISLGFHGQDLIEVIRDWAAGGEGPTSWGGYVNLHAWLDALGWTRSKLPASFVVLVASGVWVYRHRRGDLWMLLGVTAIVARLWTYHGIYDDLLMLFPLIALFRLARRGSRGATWARALFVLAAAAVVAPATPLLTPGVVGNVANTGFAVLWLVLLVFLARSAIDFPTPSRDPILPGSEGTAGR